MESYMEKEAIAAWQRAEVSIEKIMLILSNYLLQSIDNLQRLV